MAATPIVEPRTRRTVEPRVSTAATALVVIALGVGLGLHAAITVDGARQDDGLMFRLLPWLLYPGIVGIIAVRTRSELLVTVLGAVVPIAAFATMYDRLAEMGIGVPLWYAALILVGISGASYFARRPGVVWMLAAIAAGAIATAGFAIVCVMVLLMMPATSGPPR